MDGRRIPHSILVHDLLGTEFKIDTIVGFRNRTLISMASTNYGPEWNVEFSFPYMTFTDASNFWVLRERSIFYRGVGTEETCFPGSNILLTKLKR